MFRFLCCLLWIFFACASSLKRLPAWDKPGWIAGAFEAILSGEFPGVYGLAYWNERWEEEDGSISDLRIQSSPQALSVYKRYAANEAFTTDLVWQDEHLLPPEESHYYLGCNPGFGGTEDQVTDESIEEFYQMAGKGCGWLYFSNHWYDHIRFPEEAIQTIKEHHAIPFMRIMPISAFVVPDPKYSLDDIIGGVYDQDLKDFASNIASYGKPILLEFGTEVNGEWFSWNGRWNGGGETSYGDPTLPDGPERFILAYRHIVDLFRNQGATNVQWFYHINYDSVPEDASWNTYTSYYPGDRYVDWIGISVYGPLNENDPVSWYRPFADLLRPAYEAMRERAPNKNILILEFGIAEPRKIRASN